MHPSLSTILLTHFPKLTYRRYQKIVQHPELLEKISDTTASDLTNIGWEEDTAREFIHWRTTVDIKNIRALLEKENISIITCADATFPRLLTELPDPPAVLFVRGTIPTHGETIAIVGTRKTTTYGKQVTTSFAQELAARGCILVSGLALGTDSFVHEAAVQAATPTIAVLGSGVDSRSIYPRANANLAERIIASGGAIVSEYPPGFSPTPYSFPARNRIIAGLCRTVLVTEAPENSGALITARAALDYNRDVLAIPHPITSPAGVGCNQLIQQGARVVLSTQDIIGDLQLEKSIPQQLTAPAAGLESTLFLLLTHEPCPIDVLIKKSAAPSAAVTSTLLLMEMKGLVRQTGGMHYVRK
jgi:DNA processing protein